MLGQGQSMSHDSLAQHFASLERGTFHPPSLASEAMDSLWSLFQESAELEQLWSRPDEVPVAEAKGPAPPPPSPRTPTTWAKWMLESFDEAICTRGERLRPLKVASACSGMNTHSLALQDLAPQTSPPKHDSSRRVLRGGLLVIGLHPTQKKKKPEQCL